MEPIHYTDSLVVTAHDLDELRHVNNVVYLHWVQQVAERHWRAAAPEDIQMQYIWVVLSHHIQYKKPALQGDVLTLDTHVGEFEGVKSIRHVVISRGGTLLASARTEWCMLDAATMRPKRITEEVSRHFFNT